MQAAILDGMEFQKAEINHKRMKRFLDSTTGFEEEEEEEGQREAYRS